MNYYEKYLKYKAKYLKLKGSGKYRDLELETYLSDLYKIVSEKYTTMRPNVFTYLGDEEGGLRENTRGIINIIIEEIKKKDLKFIYRLFKYVDFANQDSVKNAVDRLLTLGGFTLAQLKEAGFVVRNIKIEGKTLRDLYNAGFDLVSDKEVNLATLFKSSNYKYGEIKDIITELEKKILYIYSVKP